MCTFFKMFLCFNSIRLLSYNAALCIFFVKNYKANNVLESGKGRLRCYCIDDIANTSRISRKAEEFYAFCFLDLSRKALCILTCHIYSSAGY